jgi:hypothetical protein
VIGFFERTCFSHFFNIFAYRIEDRRIVEAGESKAQKQRAVLLEPADKSIATKWVFHNYKCLIKKINNFT